MRNRRARPRTTVTCARGHAHRTLGDAMGCQREVAASRVEALAVESARDLGAVVLAAASQGKSHLPLADSDVKYLLDETVNELHRRGKIPWLGISTDLHQVFVEAWAREMTRLGVRA